MTCSGWCLFFWLSSRRDLLLPLSLPAVIPSVAKDPDALD
jgi:hypothetical protein